MGLFDRLTGAYRALVGDNIEKSFAEQPLGQPVEVDIEKSQPAREMRALLEDPLGVLQAMGYKDRQFSLSYDILRRMASKDAVIGSIINTRVNQVSTFTVPARFSRSGVGFEIRLRDPNVTPSKEDMNTITAIEQFLENTGYDNDNSRDDFDTFVRKITRDRLTFDQVSFEIVPDRKGRPAEFHAVDASTIRIASEQTQEDAMATGDFKKGDEVKYVQVVNGKIQAYFTAEELAFGVANPRSDINISGYGYSELEMLIQQVTSHIWAEEYNSRFFSQGGTTKGILNLKGNATAPISPHQLESFKRQWLSQVSGMTGAWKTPVVSVDGLEYINVSQSNREMEFEKWMNYLINIACAVYQIDPSEINFPNRGGAGSSGGGGLGDGGIEDRLNHSRDKGLRPLLRFVETMINKHIVSKFDQKYVFSFVGIDSKSEKEIATLQQMQVKVFKTVNEIRKEEGKPKLEGGDIILDPVYIQYLGQQQQAEMMKQQGMGGEQDGFGDQGDDTNQDVNEEDDNKSDEQDTTEKSISQQIEALTNNAVKFLSIEIED
ncbi:portal protein [Lysinibacillus phage vB_LfM_LysYB1]|nr:portal protein [Lysinibacillus phage vB_LfM_LysYB1]WAB25263.1 portal protein [Lysinibacillus phage vB_LfM_LysYB2]